MTIPGVNVITAATLVGAIGDIRRFPTPRQLVGYLGPRSRASASPATEPARHGRISKQGRPQPATCSSRPPGRRSAPPGRCARSRAHRARRGAHDRDRRRRAQARRARLAPAHPRRGLRVRAARRSSRARSARSSCSPARHAAGTARTGPRVRQRRHRRRRAATRRARPRPPIAGWSATGRPPAQKAGAGATPGRASQRPSKGKAARQTPSPRGLRFASSVTRTHTRASHNGARNAPGNLTFIRNAALSLNQRRRMVRSGRRAGVVARGGGRGRRSERAHLLASGSRATAPRARPGCWIAPRRRSRSRTARRRSASRSIARAAPAADDRRGDRDVPGDGALDRLGGAAADRAGQARRGSSRPSRPTATSAATPAS